jgi:putative endonuclease
MKQFNLITGKIGEEIAKKYLKKKGYKILEQNIRSRFGEIDFIVQKGKELILIEVRTKKGENFGSPEESLDKKKLKKLWFNAQSYVARKKWQDQYRIDAICIVLKLDNTLERINHYENIVG